MDEKIPDTFNPAEHDKSQIRFRVYPIVKEEQIQVPTPIGVAVMTRKKIDIYGHHFAVHTNAMHWFHKPQQLIPLISMGPAPSQWQLRPEVGVQIEVGPVRVVGNIERGIFAVMVPEYCQQTEALTLVIETINTVVSLDQNGKLWESSTRSPAKRARRKPPAD